MGDDWIYWDIDRFNLAITALCERHLVERYQRGSQDTLRTHRALQRSILQRLDKDVLKRDSIFNEVVSMIRKALPVADLFKRGDAGQLVPYTKYSPQAISLHRNFTQADPSFPSTLMFATVLQDSAFYCIHGLGQLSTPLRLLETAENICTSLVDTNPKEAKDMLVHVLSTMGPICQELGNEGRAQNLDRMSRVLNLLEEQEVGGVSPAQGTEEQAFLFARAHHDYGWHLLQANRIPDAEKWFKKSITYFSSVNKQPVLALAICDRLLVLGIQHRKQQVRNEAVSSLAIIVKEYGEDHPLALFMKFTAASALFTIGDLDDAFAMFQDIFKRRQVVLGFTHHHTLGTQYCIAVCLQHKQDLEGAETNLREILSVGRLNDGWRDEDITRVKFRLWIVLRSQNRPVEAEKLRVDFDNPLTALKALKSETEFTDEDDMALLDTDVSISHGRTAGMFSSEGKW